MALKAIDFLTPVGRLVQGDCFVPQIKEDDDGKPILDADGTPKKSWFVAIAFAKSDPEFAKFKAALEQQARLEFPHLFPNPHGPCINPNFSMKIVDGDAIDNNGRPNSSKEGFAGHWVLRSSSSYAPKCFMVGKYAPHEQLRLENGINPIPRGYYVRAAGNYCGNDGGHKNQKPGMYVNINMIEFARVGDIIISGPDPASVFGGNGAPTSTSAAPPPPGAAQAAPPPPAPITPHTAILQGPQLTAKAQFSYAQYIASNWTDADLIREGIMLPPTSTSAAPPPPGAAQAAPPPPAPTRARTPQERMLPGAQSTYDGYIAAQWTEQQLIDNGLMAAA